MSIIHIPKNQQKVRKINNNIIRTIVQFEKDIADMYNKGKIKYPIHLTSGNENSLKNIFEYISNQDWVFCSWRNHAHALLHGISKKQLFDQIKKGKSMYISSKQKRFLSSSIAGGVLPIALGVALSIKLKKQKNKVWVFLGDMTSKMGVFHEVYEYKKNLKLPLELVIEDNGKSVCTDTKKVWKLNKMTFPNDVFYYQYKLNYPHHGTGKWVSF